jgi:hypothetical protein
MSEESSHSFAPRDLKWFESDGEGEIGLALASSVRTRNQELERDALVRSVRTRNQELERDVQSLQALLVAAISERPARRAWFGALLTAGVLFAIALAWQCPRERERIVYLPSPPTTAPAASAAAVAPAPPVGAALPVAPAPPVAPTPPATQLSDHPAKSQPAKFEPPPTPLHRSPKPRKATPAIQAAEAAPTAQPKAAPAIQTAEAAPTAQARAASIIDCDDDDPLCGAFPEGKSASHGVDSGPLSNRTAPARPTGGDDDPSEHAPTPAQD